MFNFTNVFIFECSVFNNYSAYLVNAAPLAHWKACDAESSIMPLSSAPKKEWAVSSAPSRRVTGYL